jgi:hypothetical protein
MLRPWAGHQRRAGLFALLLAGVLIWWVWREMSLSALAIAILLFIAPACWMGANDPTTDQSKAGYTFSVLFILLAATIFLTRISLVLAAKASSITAIILLAIGLLSKKWARRLKDLRLRRLTRVMPDTPHHKMTDADASRIAEAMLKERGALVALESLLDGEIRLVAVTLAFISGIVWVASAILRRP